MSKKQKKTGKFAYTPTNTLPKLGKIKTTWDLKKHYYTSEKDPQIEKDLQKTERALIAFAKKFKNSDFTTNAKTLRAAYDTLAKIESDPATARPGRYFGLRTALNSGDVVAEKKLNLISERLTKASNETLFFSIELGKISATQQAKFLKDPLLQDVTYALTRIFLEAKHNLSEPEERILRLLSGPSYDMWVDATEKMLGRKTIAYKKKTIGVNEAIDLVGSVSFKEKPKLWNLITTEIASLDEVVENELTAICTRKKIGDELRGFAKPYSATALNYEDNEKSLEALVHAVSTIGFENSKRFYKLKAKLHDVKKLEYAQRTATVGDNQTIPFAQAVEICRDVFYGVKEDYGRIFDRMLTSGAIDVYPKHGKRGGAFMSGQVAQPTKVFLNHVDTMRSVETLAHEMGHAIHTECSKTQPVIYQGHSTTTAETASTLFEGLLFDAIYDQAPESARTILLHDKLLNEMSTIQRQIAFFNFELDMHTTMRTQGAMTRTELNTLMQKHLRSYLGPAVIVNEADGHSYIYVGHFRYGFYVYTYAFGILMSSIMAERYRHDRNFVEKIDEFLKAGESADVQSIFKKIGIDTEKPESFTTGLQRQTEEIATLEKLTRKNR